MSMNDLDRAIQLIETEFAVTDFAGPQPERRIEIAEAALGCDISTDLPPVPPPAGAGAVSGAEFYGVLTDDFERSGIPDAIWLTLRYRRGAVPASYVLVSETGDGGYEAIHTSRFTAEGENPVVQWVAGRPRAQ